MTIPTAAKPTPVQSFQPQIPFVNRDGTLTVEGVLHLERLRNYNLAGGRLIPCSATGTNTITLTPNDATPLLERYKFGDVFLFWAENASTGDVSMTVVPKKGTLATLKAYKSNGATRAGNGDVVQNSVYMALYAPHLDSSAGGFVIVNI